MRKYLLLLSCSLFVAASAGAVSGVDRVKAMKDIFAKEFEAMDDNGDGVLSKEEYLKHQFAYFREGLDKSAGLEETVTEVEPEVIEVKTKEEGKNSADALSGIGAAAATLQELADFDLDDDPLFNNWDDDSRPRLTKEDVMPEADDVNEDTLYLSAEDLAAVDEIDLSISEEESLHALLKDIEAKQEANTAAAEAAAVAQEAKEALQKKEAEAEDKQIRFMLGTIKKTLPKKIDDVTNWTDITYEDREISYIYQADIDSSSFSSKEKAALKKSIEEEACPQSYTDMCPKIKQTFIKQGITLKIRYLDKAETEISSCVFNNETCE